MPSLASSARLLAACTSVRDSVALLREFGFTSNLVPLSDDGIRRLGLSANLTIPHVICGKGSLRALIFEIEPASDERVTLTRAAACLCSRAPQLLFLLIAIHRERRTLSIAAFDSSGARPRVSALVVQLGAPVDSDLETICAVAAAASDSDLLTHCRWLEILGRESISRRFFRDLERVVSNLAGSLSPSITRSDGAELALLHASRLLFLSFLETKGWLDGDHAFLVNQYASCIISGGSYHRNVLNPLFFGTLNTSPPNRAHRARRFGRIPFLNGGLFNKSKLEIRTSGSRFSDEALGDVFGEVLTKYRFTAREDGASMTEAAVDPEMLGKAFECLMDTRERKTSGAYYTPQPLVREVCHAAISYGIDDVDGARVLDPACGSGAFLVHMLEELSDVRLKLGDLRSPHSIRREILTRSIFGVDVNPMAVWLCELRLWLSMAIDDPEDDPLKVKALPNLDRNIRVGDSLSGDAFSSVRIVKSGGKLAKVRAKYARATGPGKKSLASALDSLERDCAIALLKQNAARLSHERREVLTMLRSPDLFGQRHPASPDLANTLSVLRKELAAAKRERRRLEDGGALPFSFPTGFADTAAEGGFTLIVGNPPWVRTHNLETSTRSALRNKFEVYRNSAWIAGSDAAGAGKGFASQVDASSLFVERCTDLLRDNGTMSLILPAKLWRSLSGGGVRRLLLDRTSLRELHDLSTAPSSFDAAVYPSIVVATRQKASSSTQSVKAIVHRRDGIARWTVPQRQIPFDESPGSPWIVADECVRAAFNNVTRAGVPFSSTSMGRPLLGVKTGCNEAFLVSDDASVEPHLLRRSIRGDQVQRWVISRTSERIIWTHDRDGPLRTLPPAASRWLTTWRAQLERRSDAQRTTRWWSLFRTDGADSALPRVVWADIGRAPRAAVIRAGDHSVPLNTCYVARCSNIAHAHALAALLNSSLIAAWLSLVAEPARGNYMRFMGWTMSILPLPSDWNRALDILADVGAAAAGGSPPSNEELLERVLAAYRLSIPDVEALLSWSR